ncbi:MAG: hypothetical protein KKD39_05270 [Candidatus Altiarchaeota archaeon]|nr:hypothetical protein [Candidatus Altiarchaeota archaeon]
MEALDNKVFEAKMVLASLKLYRVFLDFIAVFIASAVIAQLMSANIFYSIFPALVYALLQIALQIRNTEITPYLRGEYSGLDERLKTALENDDTKNVIALDLLGDVTKRMDDVEASVFFKSKDVTKRIAVIVVLSFVFLTIVALDLKSIAAYNFKFLIEDGKLDDALKELSDGTGGGMEALFGDRWEQSNFSTENEKNKMGAESGGEKPGFNEGPIPGKGGGTGSQSGGDIYGDASSASLAGKDIDFKMHPEYGGDIEVRDTGSQMMKRKFSLDDVESVEECTDCVVGPENEEMVRRYFEKILPVT